MGGRHLTQIQSTELCISYLKEIFCSNYTRTQVCINLETVPSLWLSRYNELNLCDVQAIMHKNSIQKLQRFTETMLCTKHYANSGEDRSKEDMRSMDLESRLRIQRVCRLLCPYPSLNTLLVLHQPRPHW